jgi:diaminohydroxyphosphoribosylaminopyrimidine deaminase / 5-amino-6-(5-phosphoribosylamino)uracil reductase
LAGLFSRKTLIRFMTKDEQYMQRCLDLASKGLGSVAPNPLVGSVIVHNDRIIGEGYHRVFGGPHAEVNAIASVKETSLLPESTLYVNLEPCSHFGKTPPCSDLIIRKRIKRVVIGSVDPFDVVTGKGIARLRNNGCDVSVGVLKSHCLAINKRFFTFHEKKRPFIILKWAQTADGFIDALRPADSELRPAWITSEKLRILVHKWRSEEPAIMVGTHTALADNPRLNVREWSGKQPLRIVVDRELKLPRKLHLFDNRLETLVLNDRLDKKEHRTTYLKMAFENELVSLSHLMHYLFEKGIQSVLVEGGQKLIQSFVKQGLWDEARVFSGPQFFGEGIKAPAIKPTNLSHVIIGNEGFFWFKNFLNY